MSNRFRLSIVTTFSILQSILASRNFLWYSGSPMSLSQSATQRWSNSCSGLAISLTASSTAKRSFLQCKVLTMPICYEQRYYLSQINLQPNVVFEVQSKFISNLDIIHVYSSTHMHTHSLSPLPPLSLSLSLSLSPSFLTQQQIKIIIIVYSTHRQQSIVV